MSNLKYLLILLAFVFGCIIGTAQTADAGRPCVTATPVHHVTPTATFSKGGGTCYVPTCTPGQPCPHPVCPTYIYHAQ